MKKSRLQKWYDEQRVIKGHWAQTDYELAASLSNGELETNDGLPEWLSYNEAENNIYDINSPHIVICLEDDFNGE